MKYRRCRNKIDDTFIWWEFLPEIVEYDGKMKNGVILEVLLAVAIF